jgi:CP12 domain
METVLDADLASAIDQAYAICKRDGATAKSCLDAWKIVDAIESEVAFQRAEGLDQTAFEKFCEDYPEALDAKMYETWCSG